MTKSKAPGPLLTEDGDGSDKKPPPKKKRSDSSRKKNFTSCLAVGIGASAGGQEALEQLFALLPSDCGLSYVVIMHLPPGGPSFLAGMLGRYTPMEVVTIEDGMVLRPDRVHVIPPGRELTLQGEKLRLREPEAPRQRHPIDLFFATAAAELQGRMVGVILSGGGADGAEGIKRIKEAGGTVIVQDPRSAPYPDMPRNAVATGAVDLILPPEELAGKIAEIARGACVITHGRCLTSSLDHDLETIFGIVKNATGHDFGSYKRNTVMRRIDRRMAVNEIDGIKKYIALLQENSQEVQSLAQEILIGVTAFFRDPEAFEVMRTRVLPALLAGRAPGDTVRIWHACCATGEEVYSMAFLVREYLTEHRLDVKVQFFASDIDEAAVAQARAGLYDEGIEAEVGEKRLSTFFTKSGDKWQVIKPIREMIVFAHHSLISNPPFSRLDLLVCRNFLIYLNPDMQHRLISLFHQILKKKGFLFLGSSEAVGRHSGLFIPIDKKWKIFLRRETGRRLVDYPFTTPVRYTPGRKMRPSPTGAGDISPGLQAEKLLMERYSPPCVVVSDRYEVIHVSVRPNPYLELPVGEPTRDLLKMAREELRPALRAAIYKALTEREQVVFRGVRFIMDGVEKGVNVLAEPLADSGTALVIFEPATVTPSSSTQSADEPVVAGDTSREILIRQLEEQLRITHEQLQVVTEQLETTNEGFLSANEELISMNEEFQSTNEELQSTNEELETSKEELQALNEELVTVNAELQWKLEELNRANNDMHNLLTSSGVATLFLDRHLIIQRYTPAAAEIFNLIPADVGRPFRHLAGNMDWSGFAAEAETVLEKLLPAEREVTSLREGLCHLRRILPYRTESGMVDGIVVTLTDITEHKVLEDRTHHLASFPELNPNPVLETDISGRLTFFNPATVRTLGESGMTGADAVEFLPPDLQCILTEWNGKDEATFGREVVIGDRVFGESVFLTPQFNSARIYAYEITESKRAEEVLRRYQLLADHSRDIVLFFQRDGGRILEANLAAVSAYGYSHEEFMTLSIRDLRPSEALDGMEAQIAEADTQGILFETIHRRKDGSTFPVEVSSQGATLGGKRTLISVIRDISRRKRAEEALRQSKERYQSLFEGMLAGSAYCRMLFDDRSNPVDFVYLKVNKAFGELTGLRQITGKKVTEVIPGIRELHPELFEICGRIATTGRPEKFELEFKPLGIWLLISVYSTEPEHFVAVFDDITESKNAERRIQRQNAMLEGINRILGQALGAGTDEELGKICLSVAEELTGSMFGFIGEIGPDRLLHDIAMSNPGWERCSIPALSGPQPPGKFPIHGIYGRVLLDGKSLFTNDPSSHPDSIGTPSGHPPLTSFLGVPLLDNGTTIGLVAMANRENGYGPEQVETLEALAPAMVEALQRKRAEVRIRKQMEELQITNEELARFNNISVGRELRMIELKKELNELHARAGSSPPYPLDFDDGIEP